MATVQALLDSAGKLPAESAGRDAQILLGHCLGKARTWLYAWPEHEVDDAVRVRFEQLLARRSAGEPVAYLTGQREFWSLQLAVNEHTLIPRPETETLVEWSLELALPGNAAVLDMGTGSGAIALAIASERPHWQVTAIDNSAGALEVARRNAASAQLNAVRFLQSDWYRSIEGEAFHLILGNPPYIDAADPHLAQGDVRFEPRAALVAPEHGLADLARLVSGAPAHLPGGGWVLLEHGYDQGAAVRALFAGAGFVEIATRPDIAGHERVTGARWHAE